MKQNTCEQENDELRAETAGSRKIINYLPAIILLPLLVVLVSMLVVLSTIYNNNALVGWAIAPRVEATTKCTTGADCTPDACHNGVCTKNCYSHDECGGQGKKGYFCNYENKCAYVGEPNVRMLCSGQMFCPTCTNPEPQCDSASGSICVADVLYDDGSAYCTQSPFCITGPTHEENNNGAGNLLYGTAILPNYVKCKDNVAYRCIGYGQTEDPDYTTNVDMWHKVKCKNDETCVEGLADDGGGCIPS